MPVPFKSFQSHVSLIILSSDAVQPEPLTASLNIPEAVLKKLAVGQLVKQSAKESKGRLPY
jgi:hypothetical protein